MLLKLTLLIALAVVVSRAQADEVLPIPDGGVPVLDADHLTRSRQTEAGFTLEPVTVEGQAFAEAVRVRTLKEPQEWWDVQLLTSSITPVDRGDVLLCTFWARGTETIDEAGKPQGMVYFQEPVAPHRKSLSERFTTGKDWQRYDFPFKAQRDYPAGEGLLGFGLGFRPQTLEIGGVQVLNYGPDMRPADLPITSHSYDGQEPDAPWHAEAARRIEEIRKGDLTVRVTDAAGRPVKGAEVAVKMTRHAFPFGSAISSTYIQFSKERDPEAVARYQAKVLELFNTVAIENHLKWRAWDGWGGRERGIDTLRWLKDNGVSARGHVLVWPSWRYSPNELREEFENDPKGLREAIADSIAERAGAARGYLYEWDVMNEPATNHEFMDILGEDAMADWFRLAHEADPDVRLMLNEYSILTGGHTDSLERVVRLLLDAGAPVQAIGIQSHMGIEPVGIPQTLAALDRVAALGLPLAITEFDQATVDERLQGRYMRDFMTAIFSHPAVDAFIMWGFWENRHWKPEAALFREDWSVKPNGQAYMDLVFDEWWTEEEAQTDADGACTVRGFLGDYEVTVTHGGNTATQELSLGRDGLTQTIKLK